MRGILATCHVFLKDGVEEKDIWKVYRAEYGDEPFIRIVKERQGIYRYPEPKILAGTNFCDIGFEKDPRGNRLVVMAALDNLVKGAAGNGVQAMNVACGLPETTGLEFPGLHPGVVRTVAGFRRPTFGDSQTRHGCWTAVTHACRQDRRRIGDRRLTRRWRT